MISNSTFTTSGFGMGDMYILYTEKKKSAVNVKKMMLVVL